MSSISTTATWCSVVAMLVGSPDTYVVYAPLVLGVTSVVFEEPRPNFSRYWEVIDKHNVSQFYVAPTALRLLKRAGDKHVKHGMKKLRVLGTVGAHCRRNMEMVL
jgi:acyl-coenzyme A synthetase/AMP-(fatty) acid ligase